MAQQVHAGVHPAVAMQRARAGARMNRAATARRTGGDIRSQSEALVRQFQAFYGGRARIEIAATNGPVAMAFENGDGSATIRIDPRVPAYALPSVIGHEMGHALQMQRGPIGQGPIVELEATRIAGDFLRRANHPLEAGLRFLREGGGGSAIHGSLQDQLNALTNGYYARGN